MSYTLAEAAKAVVRGGVKLDRLSRKCQASDY
jgi:hypothetical protein